MKKIFFIGIIFILFANCNQSTESKKISYEGNYEMFISNDSNGYKQYLTIQKEKDNYYLVTFSASKVRDREACRFSDKGFVKNDTLWVNISNEKNKKVLMYIVPTDDNLGLDVFTKKYDERFYMMRYCNGGGSLAGIYIKNGIALNNVGIFNNSNTINDVLRLIPASQVKKRVGQGEFKDDVYDDYEIYYKNEHLFTLTPKDTAKLEQKINRVLIKTPFFKTEKGITVKSTYRDIKSAYTINEIEPTREHIVLIVNEINANFTISKKQLEQGWWNEENKSVNRDKIPNCVTIDDFILWWNVVN